MIADLENGRSFRMEFALDRREPAAACRFDHKVYAGVRIHNAALSRPVAVAPDVFERQALLRNLLKEGDAEAIEAVVHRSLAGEICDGYFHPPKIKHGVYRPDRHGRHAFLSFCAKL